MDVATMAQVNKLLKKMKAELRGEVVAIVNEALDEILEKPAPDPAPLEPDMPETVADPPSLIDLGGVVGGGTVGGEERVE